MIDLADLEQRLADGVELDKPTREIVLGLVRTARGRQRRDDAIAIRRAGLAARNRELACLAERFLPDLDTRPQAEEIARIWACYAANGWLRDRKAGALPEYLRNHPEEHLWLAMACKDKPLHWRQINDILIVQKQTRAIAQGPAARFGCDEETATT